VATLSTLALYTIHENRTARQLLRPAKPSNPSFPLFPRPTSGPQATRRIACLHLPSLQAHYLFPPPFSLKPNLLFSAQFILLLLLLLLLLLFPPLLHILRLEPPSPRLTADQTSTSPSRGFQVKGRKKSREASQVRDRGILSYRTIAVGFFDILSRAGPGWRRGEGKAAFPSLRMRSRGGRRGPGETWVGDLVMDSWSIYHMPLSFLLVSRWLSR
jgi:hypothetical protein